MVVGLIGIALPGQWDWTAGFLCGSAYGAWLLIYDDAPDRIDRWRRGAEGERRTEKVLKPLQRDGWTVVHDLPHGQGNIDHVVIGPAGIFLLDSKVWSGTVTVDDGGVPTVTPIDTPEDAWTLPKIPCHMRRLAANLHDDLKGRTHLRRWVKPVLVLWSTFEEGVTEADGVVLVHGDKQVSWLQTLETTVSGEEQRRLALAVSEIR
jgi:hypothetical protein